MRVLVVGQGGREHAIAATLSRDPSVEWLGAVPGNPGIAEVAVRLPGDLSDRAGLVALAEREGVDLTVVGPEAPLVDGLADAMRARGLRVFGPGVAGARIEGSKARAKELCERHGIPAPRSRIFTEVADATAFLDELRAPFVVKADGLAAGKGVTVAPDRASAEAALRASLEDRVFGEAGATVLVEEFVEGREISALALTDGSSVLPLALAQDHKRLGDGDMGPNTGGMGAYSPVPFVDEATADRIRAEVLEPAVHALAAEGIEYRGVLYAGLMLTPEGPRVLEFNCRFGDPEAQAILPRVRTPLAGLLAACADGDLAGRTVEWSPEACVTVVLASEGYPEAPRTGRPIDGIEEASSLPGVSVFHGGTEGGRGRVATAGGRVLSVSALGPDLAQARARAYEACSLISFEGMQLRRDIAATAATGDGTDTTDG